MTSRRIYSRPFITEALIDIQVKLPEAATFQSLSEVLQREKISYPIHRIRYVVRGEIRLDGQEQGRPETQRVEDGHILLAQDERQIFQARLDGFSFSRLAPYERWEVFRDETCRLWTVYQSIAQPTRITRIALRYINRLDLPMPLADLKDYLRTVPEISPDLPQNLSAYFMQLQIPQEDMGANLILNQTVLPPSSPNVVSILLDIDLFQARDIPVEDDQLWDTLDRIHTRVGSVFEACITDRLRELID